MTSLRHHCVLLAGATALATVFATLSPAFAQSAPDLAQVYAMVKQMEARVAALETENRQAKKDAAEARAEARALRQKLAAAPADVTRSRAPASLPSVQSAAAGLPVKAAAMPVYDRWRFFAGADLLYVQPRWSGNPAYQSNTVSAPPVGTQSRTNAQTDFDHDFKPTVVLSAGVVAPNGIGVRGRYWWLDSDAAFSLNNPPSTSATNFAGFATAFPLGLGITSPGFGANPNPWNETLAISSGLHLKTADFEATWQTVSGPWNLEAAGGVRYASVRQSYSVADSAPVTGPNPFNFVSSQFQTLNASHNFSGFGPTVAADARYALGWGGLSVYGNGRASWVFGTRDESATLTSLVTNPIFAPRSTIITSSASSKTSLPMLEGEVGLQWQHTIGGFEALLRAGAYAQVWFNAGNAANSDTLGTTFCDECASPNANLALVGFRLSGIVKF
jgi:hypothetical protein